MWCPSASLSVWANAWLAGQAAPDDVLDALTAWAPTHSVMAYDAVAAGRTGLPWPDMDDGGVMSLLQTVRIAAGRPVGPAGSGTSAIGLALPVPGDVRGMPAGTQFAADALAEGEAVVVSGSDGDAVGLVPIAEWSEDDADDLGVQRLSWSVYSLPATPPADIPDLGEAEYVMRSAVRSATEMLGALNLATFDGQDPRALVQQVLAAGDHHRLPDHASPRAVRVLSTAAHVDAILTVSAQNSPIGEFSPISTHSVSEARMADEALRPLAAAVRAARAAAVTSILQAAWSGG